MQETKNVERVTLTLNQMTWGVMFKRPGKNRNKIFVFPFPQPRSETIVHSLFVFGTLRLRFFLKGELVDSAVLKPFSFYACIKECDTLEEDFI